MRRLRAWFVRFQGLAAREGRDRDFAAELEGHLQLHIDDNLRAGMTPVEARRQALIKLGGIEPVRSRLRDRAGIPAIESLGRDLRFSVRLLRRAPGFTAAVVLPVALGIAATSILFSLGRHCGRCDPTATWSDCKSERSRPTSLRCSGWSRCEAVFSGLAKTVRPAQMWLC